MFKDQQTHLAAWESHVSHRILVDTKNWPRNANRGFRCPTWLQKKKSLLCTITAECVDKQHFKQNFAMWTENMMTFHRYVHNLFPWPTENIIKHLLWVKINNSSNFVQFFFSSHFIIQLQSFPSPWNHSYPAARCVYVCMLCAGARVALLNVILAHCDIISGGRVKWVHCRTYLESSWKLLIITSTAKRFESTNPGHANALACKWRDSKQLPWKLLGKVLTFGLKLIMYVAWSKLWAPFASKSSWRCSCCVS